MGGFSKNYSVHPSGDEGNPMENDPEEEFREEDYQLEVNQEERNDNELRMEGMLILMTCLLAAEFLWLLVR